VTIRTIACFLGIAIAAFYAGASIQSETRSIRTAYRAPSRGAIEVGNIQERSIVAECLRFTGPSDVLAVLYTETNPAPDVSPIFILYRLAYRAYPTRIEAATIGESGIPETLANLRQKPTLVLLLGHQASIAGYDEIARFLPGNVLLRATGKPR
jgi:hypothetical protein